VDLAGEAAKKTLKEARRVGRRVITAVADVPELVQLQRNDRALRSEMDDHLRSIGKRVLILHKRSRRESPFARFRAIMEELKALERVEEEYRSTRVRLKQVRDEMAGKAD
jgi:hypothetical protein